MLGVGIEFAHEGVTILLCRGCELSDERFDQVTAGVLENLGTAEIGGVGLHERGIEIVLTDQQAQLVTQSRLSVAGAIQSVMAIRLQRNRRGLRWSRKRPELFDTAEADSVGFSESAIDGSCFGDAHLGTANQGRNVRGIGVAVANETL